MNENNNIKILIVEDEAFIAERIYADLQDYGYEVLEPCLSPDEALQMLTTEKPDLVLLDINLNAALTGIAIAAIINEKYKIPFIFLTANTDDATMKQAAAVMPQAFLTKPVQIKTLIGTIQVAIFNHQNKKAEIVTDATAQYHFIKSGSNYRRIDWKNVTHIESDRKYAFVYEKNNAASFSLKISLELLAVQLASFDFVRVHKSFLVNLAHISAVNAKEVVIDSYKIPVGASFSPLLMQRLKMYH